MTVIVAGSGNKLSFAVIDFSVPANPVNTVVTPPFSGGCVVDCAGTLAAVGNANGGQIAIYDISSPGTPVLKATVATSLGGIGAVSFDGTNVLAGEQNGSRVVLISVSNPAAPVIVSTYSTSIESVASIALSGGLAVASGPNNLYFVVLNYASPASPSQVQFTPGTGGVFFQGVIVCDLDGSYAAVADLGGASPPTPIYLFNVSTGTPALLGTYQSDQAGVTSISVSGTTVAAASTNDATVTLVSFASPASPSAADTAAGLGGGASVKLSGSYLAAGAVNGLDVRLFSVSGTGATALGTDNTTLGSIGTLGITSAATAEPQIAVSPASLAYGTVAVNTSATQTLTLHNNGTAPLDVTGLGLPASSPAFKVSPSGTLAAITPGGSQAVTVTFTPSAVQSYSATLTMTTNDPSHHTVSVALSGAGGQSAVTWAPAALTFGTVVAGEAGTASLLISNSGSEALAVTGIGASPSVFTAAPAQASVPAKGSQAVTVGFAPAAAASYTGALTFQTSDPAHPAVSVPLSGTGLSPAQPGLEVFAIASGQLGRIWQVTAGGGWSPWDSSTWKAGAPQIAGSSAVGVNADGRLEVFGLSPDGHLGHTYQLTPQGLWSPWADIQPAMALSGPPRVLANADGRLEVFAIGTDGNLGHAFQTVAGTTTSWSGWHDLGPLITTNPAVARNADGRLEVFANGEATLGPPALGHMYQTAASTTTAWSAWSTFDDFPDNSWRITGNPAVAQNADGRLEVFAIALDGNLGHIWQNAASTTTNWSAWTDLGPAITSNPAVARNTNGSLEVFAVAPVSSGPPALGHIWQATAGGGWSAWTNFGTIPGEYSTRDDPSVAQNPDGRLEVFAIGPDGNLGHMWQNAASTTTNWSGWQDLGPAISSTPAATTNG